MDPIANMLTQIRNASQLSKPEVIVPHSKVKERIAVVLKQQGYIDGFTVEQDEVTTRTVLRITLRYIDGVADETCATRCDTSFRRFIDLTQVAFAVTRQTFPFDSTSMV